jgi:probable rRNA maturation factor
LKVLVLNRQRRVRFDLAWVRRAADLALPRCLALSADGNFALRALEEITVVIVSDVAMARLHQEFMGIAGPTDVLTFEHGEIAISAETARNYAVRYDQKVEVEIALYIIHGLLHLNGFDDLRPHAAAQMRRTQKRVLRAVCADLSKL